MFGPASAGSKTAACSGRGRGRSLWEERSDRELNDEISRLISSGAADSSSRVGVSDRCAQGLLKPRGGYRRTRRELFPVLSRIQNIGYDLGENGRTPAWYRANHRTPWVAGTVASVPFCHLQIVEDATRSGACFNSPSPAFVQDVRVMPIFRPEESDH